MGKTYCARVDCKHTDCAWHQNKAPTDRDISIAYLDEYCSWVPNIAVADTRKRLLAAICKGKKKADTNCASLRCTGGLCSYCETIADALKEEFMATYKQGESIFIPFRHGESVLDRHFGPRLYKTKEAYLKHRGESDNEELVEYTPVIIAEWIDVTKPGQVTCGGNPVYACGRCGKIYGSHEIFPSAKYCEECGAKMTGCRF